MSIHVFHINFFTFGLFKVIIIYSKIIKLKDNNKEKLLSKWRKIISNFLRRKNTHGKITILSHCRFVHDIKWNEHKSLLQNKLK